MRIVLAPQSFPGLLTASQVAAAMAEGWRRSAADDHLVCAPLSAGGVGFAAVMAEATGGQWVSVTVDDPHGTPVPAAFVLATVGGNRCAYVESAQVAGVQRKEVGRGDLGTTTSRGVGQLLLAAVESGATRVVIAVDDVLCHDGGAGVLAALGCGPESAVGRGARGLLSLERPAFTGLEAARKRFAGIELILATENTSPLLGFTGASATQVTEKGGSPELAQELEGCLGHWADAVNAALPNVQDLLAGQPRRLDRAAGSGAGGGVGFALLALGAHRRSAVEVCAQAWDLERSLDHCDLVVTAVGLADGTAMQRSSIPLVARWAEARGLPVVVVAGEVVVGRRDLMGLGVCGVYPLAENPAQLARLEREPAACLEERTARVASTWSPRF